MANTPYKICGCVHKLLFLTLVYCSICVPAIAQVPVQTEKEIQAKIRAELFLKWLQQGKWKKAVTYTIVVTGKSDEETNQRLGINEKDTPAIVIQKTADFLKRVYDKVRPETGATVKIHPKDKDLAQITYIQGDLDAFTFRYVNGEWYYTLEDYPYR